MAATNKLELVVEVSTNSANASIKSVNAHLSSLEATAVKTALGASSGIGRMTASRAKGATAGNLFADAIKFALNWAKDFIIGSVMMAAENVKVAASQSVEGQLGALRREFNNLHEDIGAQFQDDFKALIGNLRELVGWLRENTDLLTKFGQVAL